MCTCVSATDFLPLTEKNVLDVVRRVPAIKWRGWGGTDHGEITHGSRPSIYDGSDGDEASDGDDDPDTFDFCDALGIPADEINSIAKSYSSLEDRICAGVRWWLRSGSQPSWRKLLWALDAVQESEVADDIRHRAEDPTG